MLRIIECNDVLLVFVFVLQGIPHKSISILAQRIGIIGVHRVKISFKISTRCVSIVNFNAVALAGQDSMLLSRYRCCLEDRVRLIIWVIDMGGFNWHALVSIESRIVIIWVNMTRLLSFFVAVILAVSCHHLRLWEVNYYSFLILCWLVGGLVVLAFRFLEDFAGSTWLRYLCEDIKFVINEFRILLLLVSQGMV